MPWQYVEARRSVEQNEVELPSYRRQGLSQAQLVPGAEGGGKIGGDIRERVRARNDPQPVGPAHAVLDLVAEGRGRRVAVRGLRAGEKVFKSFSWAVRAPT